MATNLRLRPDAADAVKKAAAESGRTQQDVIRAAIDSYLGDKSRGMPESASIDAVILRPARHPLRRPAHRIRLPQGVTSADLLDRDDRI